MAGAVRAGLAWIHVVFAAGRNRGFLVMVGRDFGRVQMLEIVRSVGESKVSYIKLSLADSSARCQTLVTLHWYLGTVSTHLGKRPSTTFHISDHTRVSISLPLDTLWVSFSLHRLAMLMLNSSSSQVHRMRRRKLRCTSKASC
jgi:hypothetical protein